jgi:NADPH:quinone reductase-like Zn-dependent oxidoreductase
MDLSPARERRKKKRRIHRMKAITFKSFGGPVVLEWIDLPNPIPGIGEALLRTGAIEMSFADC